MPELQLAGIQSKLDRADELVSEMTAVLDDWARANPARVTYTHDGATGLHDWRLTIDADAPAKAGHLLVEIVYHLRAALDQLINRLAEAAGNPPGDKLRLQFPICGTRRTFGDVSSRMLRGVPDEARTAIAQLQPFHEGSEAGQRLQTLNRLSNKDKHRDVHPHAVLNSRVLAQDADVRAIDPVRSMRVTPNGLVGQLAKDLPVLAVVTDPPNARVQLVSIRTPKIVVAFGDESARVVSADVVAMARVVRNAVADIAAAVES